MAKIAVIGSGFSGLSAAAYLSADGHHVHVYEKNEKPGGRARQLKTNNGYLFDMGPSWYWMPEIYEQFFEDFGYKNSDFYDLRLLDPAFEIVFNNQQTINIPADFKELCELFETIEKGSSMKLQKFMRDAEFKYKTAIGNLVKMPGISITEFVNIDLIKGAMRLQIFSSFSKHVRKYFSDPKLIALMEFPVLFLGAMPQDTPALYSLMNYAGLKLGTWYPIGGFGKVISAMKEIGEKQGAVFHFNSPVEKIVIENNRASGIMTNNEKIGFDAIIASADYHHVESNLLPEFCRNYNETYWQKKTFAPSCLIFYLGVSKKIKRLKHHTLFFEEDLLQHLLQIYKKPEWPSKPLFYTCCTSKTDDTVAPEGHENLFLLMPVAPGLEDSELLREKYFKMMVGRLEKYSGEEIEKYIDYKKSYCINDFITDYNSFKGNAYGLANTLMQTAIFRSKIRNKKVKNLFYAGQLTVPGPGVPPSLISGKIAAQQLLKYINTIPHEAVI